MLPPALLSLAAAQHSAVTGRQVRSVLGERSLRRAVRLGLLVPLWRGVYAAREEPAADPPPTLTRLAAAQLTVRRPVTACLQTAAELYGFAVDDDPRTHIVGSRSTAVTGLEIHRTRPVGSLQSFRGFRVVDPAETAVRLAGAAVNAPRLLAVLDAALRSQFTTVETLTAQAATLHVDGIGAVRSLITIADGRAESPPESWLRWVCHDAGFPRPEPQFWVRCAGGASFRLDLAWPGLKLGLEYDGVQFHTGAALTRDRSRSNALAAEGWTIVSVTAPMLWSGRDRLVAQIATEINRRSTPAA